MNCKPGQLAYVVHDLFIRVGLLVVRVLRAGPVVRVVRLTEANNGNGLVWEIERPIPVRGLVIGFGEILGIDDADLRPIDQGGVNEDEVRELYASQQPEHA